MSNNLFQDVMDFATVAGSPNFIEEPVKTMALCERLIQEEVNKEFIPCLHRYMAAQSLENLVPVIDGAIDSLYVIIFLLNQMGMDGQRLWDIVQNRNMAKFPGGEAVKDAGGKVVKPEGWYGPEAELFSELIEWNTNIRGDFYKGGLIQSKSLRMDNPANTIDMEKP